MTRASATITTELIEHADGRSVAYIDATAIAVFAYQQPDDTYIIEIYSRDDTACRQVRLLLDGRPFDFERSGPAKMSNPRTHAQR